MHGTPKWITDRIPRKLPLLGLTIRGKKVRAVVNDVPKVYGSMYEAHKALSPHYRLVVPSPQGSSYSEYRSVVNPTTGLCTHLYVKFPNDNVVRVAFCSDPERWPERDNAIADYGRFDATYENWYQDRTSFEKSFRMLDTHPVLWHVPLSDPPHRSWVSSGLMNSVVTMLEPGRLIVLKIEPHLVHPTMSVPHGVDRLIQATGKDFEKAVVNFARILDSNFLPNGSPLR